MARKQNDPTLPESIGLPSNESIVKSIKEYRMNYEKSQNDVAYAAGKTRAWVAQIEGGMIDPIFFFAGFCKLYGKEEAVKVYGEDWSLYTGERLALYYAYYGVNRKESCDTLGISYTALRYMIASPNRYVNAFKEGIDKLFPRIHEDDLSHYHLIGHNSMCLIKDNSAFIFLNKNSNYKHKDTDEDYELLTAESQEFIDFHAKCDSLPDGSYDVPASKTSYR